MGLGTDIVAADDLPDGLNEDLEVEPQRLMIDVPHVESELVLPRDGIPAADLGETGDPGPDLVAASLLWGVAVEITHQEGTRPDEAHVALHHVPEPGELVKAGAAEELSERNQPLCVRQKLSVRPHSVGHGSKLDHLERAPV